MKSRITLKSILIATVVFVSSLPASIANAQETQGVTVNVPFEFSANRQPFEAGAYKFNLTPDTFGMSVINLNTGKKLYLSVRPENSSLSPDLGFLVFSQAGKDHYLSEVHFSGDIGYSKLHTPQNSANHNTNTVLQAAFHK